MGNAAEYNMKLLVERLDAAVRDGRVAEADDLASVLFRLQGGAESSAGMPADFAERVRFPEADTEKENYMKPKSIKKIVYIIAAAALVTALSVTAVATGFFGVRDLVIRDDTPVTASVQPSAGTDDFTATDVPSPVQDLIVLQGYPESPEYQAAVEWSVWCSHYDTDGSILGEVGNSANEYTERYPMYLVYSKDMADKLKEITSKYGLTPHETMTIANNAEALIEAAGTGDFLSGSSVGYSMLGGYVYNDGTFHYDGQIVLPGGLSFGYQFGNYVKGSFSDVYLNVGDADGYREWQYKTASGVSVSLALGEEKALVIADLENSFVTINVLAGSQAKDMLNDSRYTAEEIEELKEKSPDTYTDLYEFYTKPGLVKEDLEAFADLFDFSLIR